MPFFENKAIYGAGVTTFIVSPISISFASTKPAFASTTYQAGTGEEKESG